MLAVTNDRDDKTELIRLLQAAAGVAPPGTCAFPSARFSLDTGAALFGAVFDVRVFDLRTELTVPEPGPLVAYVESTATPSSR